jgi:hypothetical protein
MCLLCHSYVPKKECLFIIIFFLHVHTKEGELMIRTYDIYFIMRGPQPIELPIWDIM